MCVSPLRSGFSQYQSHAQSSRTLQWDTDPSVLQLQADSELGRRMQRLGASKITQVDFLPREMVSYSKETQTPLNAHLGARTHQTVAFTNRFFHISARLHTVDPLGCGELTGSSQHE
ncbi:hypothetical protein fugu_018396 [Takifugu bimaculatus]|uniref:Uncharacterized protein n=1 Tax=Takifugu bimaculatus TaxID=433685 RepID=A0A4Z2BL01_9TELE|nr:hypothetical protein fugu_018396 [Takifugu bimaculatus]